VAIKCAGFQRAVLINPVGYKGKKLRSVTHGFFFTSAKRTYLLAVHYCYCDWKLTITSQYTSYNKTN